MYVCLVYVSMYVCMWELLPYNNSIHYSLSYASVYVCMCTYTVSYACVCTLPVCIYMHMYVCMCVYMPGEWVTGTHSATPAVRPITCSRLSTCIYMYIYTHLCMHRIHIHAEACIPNIPRTYLFPSRYNTVQILAVILLLQ